MPVRLALGALAAAWLAFALHAVAPVSALDRFFNDDVYNALTLGAALTILARGVLVRAERAAWIVMGTGVLLWSLGDVYYTVFLENLSSPPFPSQADALYLALYPAAYAALAMLIRSRARDLRRGLWLDGLIVGLACAAVASAVALEPILHDTGSGFSKVLTNLAYPVADLILLLVAVTAIGLSGWRPSRAWLTICASLLVSSAADTAYLYQTATNTYVVGRWVDALWPAGLILLALAAWEPWKHRPREPIDTRRMVAFPAMAVVAVVVVLIYGDLQHAYLPAIGLAAATMALAIARMVMMLRENARMLAHSRRQALTDPLTGLGNRRRLIADLDAATEGASEQDPLLLVLYDLNGFKDYNDTFGHAAGDAVLARLGEKLAAAAGPGRAYRMGGDEFCTLLRCPAEDESRRLSRCTAALSEHGPGFELSSSEGAVHIPSEADRPSLALQIADQRMYAHKEGRPGSAKQQLRDVLLQAFQEREPGLQEHHRGVGALAAAVGQRLGLSVEELDVLGRAAELHDVGKIAIPEAILEKPGPLTEEEWRFMRRHTILGERILNAAPALRPVAKLVRASHERYDGRGYPDGVAGEQIPLGARIIAVCDAYDAMIYDRPYRRALTQAEALRRLVAARGSQFDPEVVAAFVDILVHPPPALPAGAGAAHRNGGASARRGARAGV